MRCGTLIKEEEEGDLNDWMYISYNIFKILVFNY